MHYAKVRLKVGDEWREIGDAVPEAMFWAITADMVASNQLEFRDEGAKDEKLRRDGLPGSTEAERATKLEDQAADAEAKADKARTEADTAADAVPSSGPMISPVNESVSRAPVPPGGRLPTPVDPNALRNPRTGK